MKQAKLIAQLVAIHVGMENVESGSDHEIYRDKDGTLYEYDYDGLDLLGIFKIDQDRNILEEIYRCED